MTFTVSRVGSAKRRKERSHRLIGILCWMLRLRGPLISIGRLLWRRYEEGEKEKRHRRLWRVLRPVGMILLIVVVLGSGAVWALSRSPMRTFQTVAEFAGSPPPVDRFGHTNILLLGVGDADHDGVDLTDSVMIASIDSKDTKSIVMLSLPRDLYFLRTARMGPGRINTLYRDYKIALLHAGVQKEEASLQALKELGQELTAQLGVEIHGVLKMDFSGFVQVVDAIGGVEVEVPSAIVDAEYPGPNYTYQTFSLSAGLQTLDGETALKYARSRHSTSDFDRSRRQQQLLKAIGERVRSGGILQKTSRLLDILSAVQAHFESTLSNSTLIAMAAEGVKLDFSKIVTLQLNDQNGLYGVPIYPGGFLYTPPRDQFGGAFVLLPVSIPPSPVTWRQVQTLAALYFNDRSLYINTPTIDVLNAGAKPGSSRTLAGELIKYGMEIGEIENADAKQDTSMILVPPNLAAQGKILAEMIDLPLTQEASSGTSATVRIFLGKNYLFRPLQDTVQP